MQSFPPEAARDKLLAKKGDTWGYVSGNRSSYFREFG
jgi:hypothetical protein